MPPEATGKPQSRMPPAPAAHDGACRSPAWFGGFIRQEIKLWTSVLTLRGALWLDGRQQR
jgi:hypothetical protein